MNIWVCGQCKKISCVRDERPQEKCNLCGTVSWRQETEKPPEPPIPHIFMHGCSVAIDVMRSANLNDAQIACIIQDVRSITLSEEFRRITSLLGAHPPHHHTWGQFMRRMQP